jgi:NADH:ubiquinone oxidoreductase subunit 3 (subunit A)
MDNFFLTPPVVFIIVLLFCLLLSFLFSKISFKSGQQEKGSGEPYACGEENYDPMAQPDYSNFFHFAFFFTIAHVATLMLTTIPVETLKTFALAAVYVLGAIIGLSILLRR